MSNFQSIVDTEFQKVIDWYNQFDILDIDVLKSSMQQTFVIIAIYTVNEFLYESIFREHITSKINSGGESDFYKNREVIKCNQVIGKNDSGDWTAFKNICTDIFGRGILNLLNSQIKGNTDIEILKSTTGKFSERRNKKVHSSIEYFQNSISDFDYTKIPDLINKLKRGFKALYTEYEVLINSKL